MGFKFVLFSIFVFASFILGCAATSPTTKYTFNKNLGRCYDDDFIKVAERVLFKNNYEIFESAIDRSNIIHIETYWKPRMPFSDESSLGITEVESRIILQATRRRGKDGEWFTASFRGESQMRIGKKGDWEKSALTNDSSDYFLDIADDIRLSLKKLKF